MIGKRLPAVAAIVVALTAAGIAVVPTDTIADAAQDSPGIVSEIKAGILQHDIDFLPESREDGQAINAEILFRSPFPRGDSWSIRPHLGTSIALEGKTDQIYAGLTLTAHPFDGAIAPLWLSAFGGGAVHDGELENAGPDEKALGSRVLFRFGAEVGWDITERLDASLYYAHISNAYLADPNPGLEQAGLRLGWRF